MPDAEKGLPACEVHVPGRDEPSPWCAACRMSGAAPMPDAENGRPLGAASGGDPGFWDRLGTDDAGMPRHLPMGVLDAGQGPVGDDIAHHYVCWCGDVECPLTLALGHAWKAGRRVLPPGRQ